MKRKHIVSLIVIIFLLSGITYLFYDNSRIGKKIDEYRGVPVYYNGILYAKSHGENYSTDGYYYGFKWQCVEYVKRFYYDAKNHSMPDGYGNAKDFFDENVAEGELNERRNLIQYRNGGNMKPKEDDLIVFNDTKYGHVAIVTKVTDQYIEVIQQNVWGKSREKYKLVEKDNKYFVGDKHKPAGWLRKDEE